MPQKRALNCIIVILQRSAGRRNLLTLPVAILNINQRHSRSSLKIFFFCFSSNGIKCYCKYISSILPKHVTRILEIVYPQMVFTDDV